MKQCMDADNLHRQAAQNHRPGAGNRPDGGRGCPLRGRSGADQRRQIRAATAAAKVVLEGHIKHCVRDGIEHGDADKTIESFTKAVERFLQYELIAMQYRIQAKSSLRPTAFSLRA